MRREWRVRRGCEGAPVPLFQQTLFGERACWLLEEAGPAHGLCKGLNKGLPLGHDWPVFHQILYITVAGGLGGRKNWCCRQNGLALHMHSHVVWLLLYHLFAIIRLNKMNSRTAIGVGACAVQEKKRSHEHCTFLVIRFACSSD